MITEKKNQHYLPKFYLKNFSFQDNKKQLGVFNIFNQIYIQKAKLKTQASKNFFYGYDGQIEDGLANIEGHLAKVIADIIRDNTLPSRYSKAHYNLLLFVTLTDLRNPVKIENIKKMVEQAKDKVLEIDPNTDLEKLFPNINHEDYIKMSLASTLPTSNNMLDLDYKILTNKTDIPFITSDYPIVKYNQFLEKNNWQHGKTGYGLVGLQIFIPLNSEDILLFFDSNIYKVGNRKQKIINITDKSDIDQLNILQFVNCFKTIFFNENASEQYIRSLLKKSKNFNRANISRAELSYLFEQGEDVNKTITPEQRNLIVFGSTDCEVKLNIKGIKIHSKGKSYKFTNSVAQLRPHAEQLIKLEESSDG